MPSIMYLSYQIFFYVFRKVKSLLQEPLHCKHTLSAVTFLTTVSAPCDGLLFNSMQKQEASVTVNLFLPVFFLSRQI